MTSINFYSKIGAKITKTCIYINVDNLRQSTHTDQNYSATRFNNKSYPDSHFQLIHITHRVDYSLTANVSLELLMIIILYKYRSTRSEILCIK